MAHPTSSFGKPEELGKFEWLSGSTRYSLEHPGLGVDNQTLGGCLHFNSAKTQKAVLATS